MREELVTFETAVLAKEKGFDWGVRHYYGSPMNPHICYAKSDYAIPRDYDSKDKGNPAYYISAPTLSLLQRWLREIKQVEIVVSPRNKDKGMFYGCSVLTDDLHSSVGSEFKSYEEALEKGLMFALKLLK